MIKEREPKFQNSDVLRMFPAFVWKGELSLEIYGPINDSIIRQLGVMGAPLADVKSRESWQSDQGLHRLAQFGELVDWVNEATDSVLDYLKVGHEGFTITGCWANVSARGAGHPMHSHPNNFLSGVYYVQTAQGADTINFHDPRPQTGIIRPPVTELTAENTDLVALKVTDGTLLMFPAWLPHSVEPNRSATTRISIGFNIMFNAYAEVMGRPLWGPGRRSPI